MSGNELNPPRCRTRRRLNALSVAQIVCEMQRGPVTLHDLVEHTGLAIMTVRSYVLTLHKLGGCRIAHWEQSRRGAYTTPAWVIGTGRDAPRPPRRPHAEVCREYRARLAMLDTLRTLAGATA